MMDCANTAQLAQRFSDAIEATDLQALEQIYAPDAVIWYNFDNSEHTRAENIAVIATFPRLFSAFKYTQVRRNYFEGGFVQQHVVRATRVSGESFAVPACMVVRVRGDRIVRLDEYFDSAQDARRPEDR